MRKYVLAAVACVFTVGLALAGEVTFLSFDKDKNELKVKDGDDTKTYKVSDKTKFSRTGKDGTAKDIDNAKGVEQLTKMNDDDKAKGKRKMDITTDKDNVTEIKFKGGKGKN